MKHMHCLTLLIIATFVAGASVAGADRAVALKANAHVTPIISTNRIVRPDPPKPGIYKAHPYSGLVIVPVPHADQASIVKPKESSDRMPMIVPELQLRRWNRR
jgi:hypothetical protein